MTTSQNVALVTGGSRGIGRAVVEALLERGFKVHFCGGFAVIARGLPRCSPTHASARLSEWVSPPAVRQDMIDVKRRFLAFLRQAAVFTAISSPPHDETAELGRDTFSQASDPNSKRRVRSLMRESISARSTRPSASRRSSGVSSSPWS